MSGLMSMLGQHTQAAIDVMSGELTRMRFGGVSRRRCSGCRACRAGEGVL